MDQPRVTDYFQKLSQLMISMEVTDGTGAPLDLVNIAIDGYMGVSFFDDREFGSEPNCLGETYRTRSLGLSPLKCDAVGNIVPAGPP